MNRADSLELIQLEKLDYILGEVWERNPFYTYKWCQAGVNLHRLTAIEELKSFPLTTRSELLADQESTPPLGANLTCPSSAVKRVHRSSGTTRAPLYWADTPKSWAWVMRCSESLFLMAGITPDDRIFFALPFGQSSGPWIMYEGALKLGCCCLTAGQSPRFDGEQDGVEKRTEAIAEERLRCIKRFHPNVVVGRPRDLCQLGTALANSGDSGARRDVEKLILTGAYAGVAERRQLEELWSAVCFDRYGLTEAGSVAGECVAHPGGMHLLEREFIAEVLDPDTCEPVHEGMSGELVLTTLGRVSRPIVRYRTGDFVRLIRDHQCPCGRTEALVVGGISRNPGLPKHFT